MFESNEMMFYTEQSLVTFAIAWLEYVLRQSESIIKRIIKSFCMNKLSASYIYAEHKLLSIWPGYSKWLYQNASSIGLSSTECIHINPTNLEQIERKCWSATPNEVLRQL